ncbi:Reverse transcriptase (RNA-dependent DNA polymerase) [Popillia japonica]|uniref:Reverse transcriptase (RNA-dependent DNA polymerase) n=1 Tax=Popillia japonica TaxID=7064 RepID=A0AAW1LRC1_POPJA
MDTECDFDTEAHFAALSVGHFLSDVPQSYAEAVKCGNEWKRAIEDELNVLQENRTWELVPYPKNEKVIDSKWVFREKEVDGKIERKARLVARGYQQDSLSEEVYAPVARMVTLRILLSLYIQYDWKVMQLDVKSAFLNVSSETRHPVIVYIHGESFEWNSGNPYDGSVLSAYADLVVVTLNYRLGILGKN